MLIPKNPKKFTTEEKAKLSKDLAVVMNENKHDIDDVYEHTGICRETVERALGAREYEFITPTNLKNLYVKYIDKNKMEENIYSVVVTKNNVVLMNITSSNLKAFNRLIANMSAIK